MSALGQKQTLKRFHPMSALPPKADMDQHGCDVRLVPKANIGSLFDYLVCNAQQSRRNDEPEHPSGRTIDNQLKLARLHHWQIRGFRALEDAAAVVANLAISFPYVRTVTHQSADFGMFAILIYCRNRMTCR